MGKTKKLYLAKRMLAMILAAAMSVTMIPTTALAAPADEDAVESIVNDAAEGSGDVNAPEDEGGSEDSVPDADAADGAVADGGKTEVNAEGDTPAAKPEYEIILSNSFKSEAVYNGNYQFASIRGDVTLKKDGIPVPYGENDVVCTWKQKGADGTYADMDTTPKNAGSYRAVLTYEGAESVSVDCEITKAPVTVNLTSASLNVKPGTVREKVEVPEIDSLTCNGSGLDPQDVTLVLNKIRNAVTDEEVTAGTALKKNGDYVMDLTPDFSDKASADQKNNYVLKPFTADIKMAALITTKITVKLADKWRQEGETEATQITKDYDGLAIVPTVNTDFTFEVFCEDASAEGGWKKLDGAEVTGEWQPYKYDEDGDPEVDADGKVPAPTDAGYYTYNVVYQGKDGVYAGSTANISVEITSMELTVEAANTAPLTVMEGTTVGEALSMIEYKVLDKAGKDVTADVKAKHIWGTSYDEYSESQIYEPLFTLQVSADDGTSWSDISAWSADETLRADKKYRALFNGRKAVFKPENYNDLGYYIYAGNINERYANGVDRNYYTNTTTADGKELAVQVTPGTEAVIDVSKLLGDNLGASSIENLKAVKEYDGQRIFQTRSQYKEKVGLKGKADNAEIKTEFGEFSYTWEKYKGGDRIDAQVADKNQQTLWWDECYMLSPEDAGVYRLTITYEDKIDDGKFYYVKEPAVVYFAIDPKQVKLVPKAPETPYEVMEGSDAWRFFNEQEPAYDVKDPAGAAVTIADKSIVPHGKIVRTEQQTAPAEPVTSDFDQEYGSSDWYYFEKDIKFSYQLYGAELRRYDPDYYGGYVADQNYTCYSSELVMDGSVAERKSTDLNTDHLDIAVASMGTEKLTITKDLTKWTAKEKVYDAKPFEEKELIAEGLVTVSDAEVKLKYRAYDVENDYEIDLEDAMDAGTYVLYACFNGDKKYAPYIPDEQDDPDGRGIGVKLGTFRITPREITLTADLDESYTAGTTVSSVLSDVRKRYQVTNPAPGQEDAFAGKSYFKVTEAGSKTALSTSYKLQREKNYEVRYNDSYSLGWWEDEDVWVDLDRNYTVKDAPVAKFGTVPGNSTITSVSYSNYGSSIASVWIQTQNDASDPMKREVTMTEAIKWSELGLSYSEKKEGNFVAFQFTAPAEYSAMPATAMYRNEIEAKGGYIVYSSQYSKYFTAVFDAAEGDKEIKLRWEDGYVETYTLKFSEAVKLENLNNAVAPKALAFNAPNKKMAVGQEQQLDVKITKEQMGDVIYLGYESNDTSTLVVDKYGNVTALKLGSATITVFPQKLVNGKAERIKNAKSAALKIQVTKLEAPKKVKATVHDTYIGLDYDSPAYGYRREIYVVKKSGSFKTAQNFETALKGMKENQWKAKGFAIAPIYLDEDSEKENRENYKCAALAEGLDVKTDYTIYVRNVCAVRTLTDGTGGVVTQTAMNDSASGVVVNAKTKKTEIYDLALMVSSDGGWDYIYGEHRILWLSKLKNGVAQIEPYGLFPAIAADPAADPGDMVRIKLPFTGEDKAKYKDIYEEPKLEYVLWNCFDKKTGTRGWGTKNEYASIDKKGKIRFTGIPREDDPLVVEVLVNGSEASGGYADFYFLDEADSVKAAKKSVTLSVGQGQYLGDLLTYNLGKMKLTAYPDRYIDVEKVRSVIKSQNQEKNFTVSDSGVLTAINGGGTLTLDLTDKNVEKISGTDKATAKITIKSKDLEQVKSLKAYNVIHNNFGLTFKYTGGASEFLLEISDAKKPIYSKVISNTSSAIQPLKATDKDGRYIYVRDARGNSTGRFAVVKDTYEISDSYIKGLGIKLYKESQYTVTLTPIYGANKAKAAAARVKTTKIPALDSYLNNVRDWQSDDENGWTWGCDRRGGMGITVSEGNRNLNLSSSKTTLNAVSGDTYTLTANVQYNRGRVNDTLVWTVGNSKVASVKTAAGTYCITLKGLKPGKTTLEVKSKIMGNKVIARYDINVSAVQDAYRGNGRDDHRYYGENEPE